MRKLLTPTLLALALTLPGCGGGSDTDAEYPEGVAPNGNAGAQGSRARPGRPNAVTPADPDAQGGGTTPDGPGTTDPAPDPDPGPDAGTHNEPETHTERGLVYTVPTGWGVDRSIETRVVTLTPGEGVTVAVALWPGNIGGFERNFVRWIGMAGYEPSDTPALRDAIETLDLGGVESQWIPLIDGPGEGDPMISVWVPRPGVGGRGQTWTLKITGSADELHAQHDALRAWVESLRFE